MYNVNAEFPEINRKCVLVCSPASGVIKADDSSAHINMGCHVRLLSSIVLSINWKSVQPITPEPGFKGIQMDSWGAPSGTEQDNILKALAKFVVPESEKERIFKAIAETFNRKYGSDSPTGPTFVMMADNINSYTPEFPKNSGVHDANKAPGFKTADFVGWLVKNKVGVVVSSPVSTNQYHQGRVNYSLTQAWIWVPPNFTKYAVPGSSFVSGEDQLLTLAEWRNLARKATQNEKLSDSELDARMWKGGKLNSHLAYIGNTDIGGK